MSRAYDSMYMIEAARREAIFNERVCSKTEEFYNRYLKQYNDMVDEGFEQYIPNEMNRLKGDLNEIKRLLSNNQGVLAREESITVGSYIHTMIPLGKSARRNFERAERLNKELEAEKLKESKNEGLKYYYEAINTITDPVVRDFAKSELAELKKSILNMTDTSLKNKETMIEYIDKRIKDINVVATEKAEQWKSKSISESKKEVEKEMIKNIEDEFNATTIEDTSESNKIIEMIEKLKENIELDKLNTDETYSKIQEISKHIDDVVISENVRKEAVKSIVNSLRKQEFSVEKVELVENKDHNFVRIVAKKPSGKRAECRVGLNGELKYKFDNYNGMTCIQDIEQFDVDLKEIYSVTLSNENIIWENPIRISKDAKEIENTNTRGL